MTPKAVLTIIAVIYILFGLGFYVTPETAGGNFGLKFLPAGILHTRILGAALIGFGVTYWLIRAEPPNPTLRAIMWGSCLYNLLDLPWLVVAIGAGTLNPMGWGAFVMHVLLAAGFAYVATRPTAR